MSEVWIFLYNTNFDKSRADLNNARRERSLTACRGYDNGLEAKLREKNEKTFGNKNTPN